MGSFWNMFSKKSKDKVLVPVKSDSNTSTYIFSTDGATTSAGSAITSFKSKYKSNSNGSSSKTKITVTTNETTSKAHGLTVGRKLDTSPMSSVMSSSKFTTSTYKSTEIHKSVSTNPSTRDAIPFNTPYVSPYRTTNIPTFNTPTLVPSEVKISKTTYQSPYRNLSAISSTGDKKTSFVSTANGNWVSANPNTAKKSTIPAIWNPLTSITSSKPVTSSWNNNSSLAPLTSNYNSNNPSASKTSSTIAHQKTPEALAVKPKGKQSPGIVYIFHNDKFDTRDKEFREGSAADVRLLKNTFQKFRMSINTYDNFTVKEVNNAVQKIERKDFGSYSCIVIVILTHGTRYGNVAARDGSYSIDDNVLFPILRNSSLRSKPKLFFIQACKGNMEPGHLHKDAMQPSGVPEEILKCYSTFEGYVAYRTDKGTFFIQSLCELLQEHGKTKNIKDIMDLVIKRVKEISRNKQIPSYETTLTEPYIFGNYI